MDQQGIHTRTDAERMSLLSVFTTNQHAIPIQFHVYIQEASRCMERSWREETDRLLHFLLLLEQRHGWCLPRHATVPLWQDLMLRQGYVI